MNEMYTYLAHLLAGMPRMPLESRVVTPRKGSKPFTAYGTEATGKYCCRPREFQKKPGFEIIDPTGRTIYANDKEEYVSLLALLNHPSVMKLAFREFDLSVPPNDMNGNAIMSEANWAPLSESLRSSFWEAHVSTHFTQVGTGPKAKKEAAAPEAPDAAAQARARHLSAAKAKAADRRLARARKQKALDDAQEALDAEEEADDAGPSF